VRFTLLIALTLTAALTADSTAEVRRDRHGDPLPAEAVQRFGLAQHRFPGAVFQFTADGKSIVAISWGRYVSRLDASTGRVTEHFTLPVEDAHNAHLFPDGRRAILVRRPPDGFGGDISWEVWDLERRAAVNTVSAVQWDWEPTFGPAGDLIAATSHRSGTDAAAIVLHLIDARTGRVREIDRLALEPGQSQCQLRAVVSTDRKQVVYGSWSNGIAHLRAWDVATASSPWDARVAISNSPQIAPLPAGKWLVYDREKNRVIDGASGKESDDRAPNVSGVTIVYVTPQGHRLVLASVAAGQRLHVWDGPTGRSRSGSDGWAVEPPASWSLVPSPGGKTALIDGSEARLVDLETGKVVWGDTWADGHTAAVEQLRISADGSRLASAAADGTIRVWDATDGRPLGLWKATGYSTGHPYWSHGSSGFGIVNQVPMDLSADGHQLLFIESAGFQEPTTIRIANVSTGKAAASRPLPVAKAVAGWPELPGAAAFSPDGGSVVVTYGTGGDTSVFTANQTTARWDVATDRWTVLGRTEGAPVSRTAVGRSRPVRLTYGKVHSTATAREVLELTGAGFGPLALSADDRLVAGVGRATEDRAQGLRPDIQDLRVWDARTGEVVARIPWGLPDLQGPAPWSPYSHRTGPNPSELRWAWPKVMALNATGRLLATSDPAGVRLWDVTSGRVIHTYPVAERPPIDHAEGRVAEALAFTPDGSRLATGMPDGTILFWRVPTLSPNPPKVGDLPDVWADLTGPDPVKGWRAAWRLMDDPTAAVRLIRDRLKPAAPIPAADVARLLADVDAPDFRRREGAAKRLTAAIDQLLPAVTAAEKSPGASPELRERLRKVLAAAPADDRPLPAWAAAQSRAVAVLEHAGTADARAALRELAGGAPGAWLTREAEAAMSRPGTQSK
jgi:WD40 repeat protein